MALTSPTPTPSVTVAPTPVATTITVVSAPAVTHPTLYNQIAGVDPLIWSVLVGALVIPFVQQGIKALAGHFNHDLGNSSKTILLALLSAFTGFLLQLQSSGVLNNLGSPLLASILTAAIAFFTGHNVYQLFIKTNQQLDAVKALPVATDL